MRVLLIEDDRATAHAIELMLKLKNFDCCITYLGEEGFNLGKEYLMLELLSIRKGTTLTKEMFLYGGRDEPEMKIIDVFMCKLRKKLANASNGKEYIETVWGRGYVLRDPRRGQSVNPRLSLCCVRAHKAPAPAIAAFPVRRLFAAKRR